MSGLPLESLPRVFSVGPGPRMTYGTGSRIAATRATMTAPPAMYSVRARRDMTGRLRAPDPFAVAAGEALVLPDRHGRLELIDQHPAGVEGVTAVRTRNCHDDGQLADPQVPDTVHGRERLHRVLPRDVLGDPAQLRLGRRMRAVGQAGDRTVVVVVAHGAREQRDPARAVCHDGGLHLIDRQRRVTQPDQADGTHRPQVTRPRGQVPPTRPRGQVPPTRPRGQVPLRRRRAIRTIAAVPMTAPAPTAAPAAVIVASLRVIR